MPNTFSLDILKYTTIYNYYCSDMLYIMILTTNLLYLLHL